MTGKFDVAIDRDECGSATHQSSTRKDHHATPYPSGRIPPGGIHDNSGSVDGNSAC